MKLIQEHGQPHYGRFNQPVSEINRENYHNPFLAHPLKKKLRYKKFSFVGIQHEQFSVGFAVVDMALIGHGFYYCYDRKTEQSDDYNALQPVVLSTQVQEATTQNQFNYFKSSQIEIFTKQTKKARNILIRRKHQILCEAEIDCRERQPLYMCSPTGVRGWTYTHKSVALPIKGYVNFKNQNIEFNEQSFASIDDSCGYLRPDTEWFWLSCQANINGQKIGINFASGVNESVGNENCLWIDGKIYTIDDVVFERINERTWQIYTLNRDVDLTVYTTWRRYENVNTAILASEFSQWMAMIDGKISVNQQQIEFSSVYALLEEHFTKW